MQTEGVLAAAHLPTDGHVDPSGVTNAMAAGATELGCSIHRHTPVRGLSRHRDCWVIDTPHGEVRADIVVNAAGQWAPQVGRLAGVELPIVSLEHHYVVTEPVDVVRRARPGAAGPARSRGLVLRAGRRARRCSSARSRRRRRHGRSTGSPRASTGGCCRHASSMIEDVLLGRRAPDPRVRARRAAHADQRPGRLHPRRPRADRPSAGRARHARDRGLLDLRDRVRRRRRAPPRRTGSSTASRATTCPSSTSAASATTPPPGSS